MIKFSGELSEEAKKFILKNNTFNNACACIAVSIIGIAITIAVAVTLQMYIILTFLLVFVALAIFGCLPYKKTLYQQVPTAVIIEDNNIYLENNLSGYSRNMEHVKNVIDMRDWYQIKFCFPHKNVLFVCQKNLITMGTLEEFEQLFEGKIKRKIK